ncbi:Aldehyde dehydrogenase family 3 member B1, partial [Myotis davidii]
DPFEDTLQRLREAFRSGRTRPAEFRAAQLKGLGRFLQDNKQLLQEALAQDLRKSAFQADMSEIILCQKEVDLALRNLHAWMKDQPVAKNLLTQLSSAFIRKEPFGLVLILSPWNYPVNLSLLPLVGALAAGNCVVLKPSEISQSTEKVLAEVLPRYLDQSCFAVMLGGPEEAGQLLKHKFDYILFTGSPRVGKIVMAAAAKHLTPVTLELGGKNPCYVDDNCDAQTVANRVAFFRYFNAGQTCVAPDYILCSPEMQERLVVNQVLAQTSSGNFGGNEGFMYQTLWSMPMGGVGEPCPPPPAAPTPGKPVWVLQTQKSPVLPSFTVTVDLSPGPLTASVSLSAKWLLEWPGFP